MIKIVKYLVLFISTFLMLFWASSCNNTSKQDIPKPMIKPLVWHIDGLPNWFILNHSRIIYKRWNIDYVLDGCAGSIAGMKQNKITAKILEKRHGKFWHEVFWQSVNEELANRFVIFDLINSYSEVVRIKNEYGKKQEDMNMRILCLDKYKYAVLVTWYVPNEENKHIPSLQLIVNLATKVVRESNNKIKYDWRGGY